MSNDFAIRLTNVGKMYKLYTFRKAGLFNAIGISRLLPRRYREFPEFWALRNLDLELKRGKRLGIIGRNGAGKSTLLKLITGNFAPTEGKIEVNGKVQALFDVGAGFHPEFTGYENVRASLAIQGVNTREIEMAVEDIAAFTELGPFLNQPFKTYSLGMQSRLGFAVATAIKPEILIVDEILGAGDAYFTGKSIERMRQLSIDSGASVLIVSHALSEIIRYCEEAIWIERGHIVKRGPSMEVITAYEGFIHTLEDRRIRARNQKVLRGLKTSFQLDNYSDTLVLTFIFQGGVGTACDISKIQLVKNGQIEEELRVGDAQDTNASFPAFLTSENFHWSKPQHDDTGYFRSLTRGSNSSIVQLGYAVFYSYGLFGLESYAIRVRYRHPANSNLSLTVSQNGAIIHDQVALPETGPEWLETELPLKIYASHPEKIGQEKKEVLSQAAELKKPGSTTGEDIKKSGSEPSDQALIREHQVVHWPSEGSLTIEKITLRGEDGEGQTIFKVHSPMTVFMTVMAHRNGHFNFLPVAALYRLDGILVSNFVGGTTPLDMVQGETRVFRLEIPSIKLGDGNYVFAFAIFESAVKEDSRYDLIDRCYELKIIGNRPEEKEATFQHPGGWQT